MNGTILLAVDHCGTAKRIAALAQDLARPQHNAVVVLHVHPVATAHRGRFVVEQQPDEDCVAEAVAKDLLDAGVDATYETVRAPIGGTARAIGAEADRLDAALTIIGAHGDHRGLRRTNRPLLLVPSD